VSDMRDFSTTRRRARTTPLERGLVVAAALLFVAAAAAAGSGWADLRQATVALDEVRKETREAEARIQALDTRPGPTEALAARAVASAAAPPPRVVAELAALLPPDVRLEQLGMRYGRGVTLEMSVTARHAAAYDMFLERLERSPLFADVTPGDESRSRGARATIVVSYQGDLR
jgi:Tfp pilus assembly protein PilN